MKKLLVLMMTLALAISMIACGTKEETPTADATANADVDLDVLVDAIKKAYGDEYLPNMRVENEMLESPYGLTEDLYQEVFVEVPAISAQSDILIAVKVADGKQEEVVKTLNDYRDYLLNDAMQYPMNQLKLQASRVIEREGFVFFVSLGVIPMEIEEDSEIIAKATELNDIAEKVIDAEFDKANAEQK